MKKIGRNEPCPCGCGRKFKVCLAQRRETHTAENRKVNAEKMRQAKRSLDRLSIMVAVAGGLNISPEMPN